VGVEEIRALRRAGHHEQARELAVELAARAPHDAHAHYEAACVHDYLGLEAQAVPYYERAIAAGLPPELLRRAYAGLGSTHRALGRYEEALAVLERGLERFPGARELTVFHAMCLHNLGRSKEALEALLKTLAETANDPHLESYRRAIAFYAQDLDRSWPGDGS
jgi:tetratricopeptide (TPR) repeat protein